MTEFQLVPPSDYKIAAELLKQNFPKTVTFSNLLKYDIPKELYARRLENNEIDPNAVLIKTKLSNPNLISCYAPNCLQDILEDSTVMDWSQEILFFDLPESDLPTYKKISEKHGVSFSTHLVDYMVLEDYTKVPSSVKIPEGLTVRDLGPEEAEILHSHWKYSRRLPKCKFEELLRIGGGIGLFRDDTGQMISWIGISDYGSMGFLHTLPEHRRKGYAAIVSALMVQKTLKMGLIPFCHLDNEDSPAIFTRMGFKRYTNAYWCFHTPK